MAIFFKDDLNIQMRVVRQSVDDFSTLQKSVNKKWLAPPTQAVIVRDLKP